jgi:diaminohydroxyphosphoribosylaminopyrimidine deaminase/5-amino-6-(5-phosphoribosylamino)uracil reductase
LRVIVGDKLIYDENLKIFRDKNVLIACSDAMSVKSRKCFTDASIPAKSFGKKRVSLKRLLKYLLSRGIQSVFVEGGGSMNGSLFDENLSDSKLIDRVVFYYAPKLIGGNQSVSVVGGNGIEKIAQAVEIRKSKIDLIDGDLKYEGLINFY